MDLNIHVPTGTLLADRKSKSPLAELKVTQKNGFGVNVWFLDDGPDVSQPVTVIPVPAPFTRIVLSARPNDDLDNTNLLFFLDSFAAAGSDQTLHYTGTLDTATADIAALFTTAGKTRYPALLDIDLLVTADPADGRHTVLKQRDLWIYRALWQGAEGIDPDASPAYPSPSAILTTDDVATQAEAEAGAANDRWMTPLRTAQAIAAIGGEGGGSATTYTLKTASFDAESGKAYAVDTTSAGITATLPASPAAGDVIAFADAKNTWHTNPPTVSRNGKPIEGVSVNFVNSQRGSFFSLVFVDDTTGWRVLASGTVPMNLTAPTISAQYAGVAASVVSTGSWTGSPTGFAYQWQKRATELDDWADVTGATADSLTTDETDIGKFVRCLVVAQNANGPSAPAPSASSAALEEMTVAAIPNLAVWLDASAAESLRTTGGGQAANGQAVTEWRDLSGNDNHATHGDNAGTAPVLDTTFASLGGVRFTEGLLRAAAFVPFAENGGSIFLVEKCAATDAGSYYGASHNFGVLSVGNHQPYSGAYHESFARGTRAQWAMGIQSSIHVLSAVSGESWSAWKNDTEVYSENSNTPQNSTCKVIGCADDREESGYWYDGHIGEVLIFSRALTVGERELVVDYLMGKWGI